MSSSYLRGVTQSLPKPFTAGDLVDGLGFLEPVWRKAILFGLEQKLSAADVVAMTHAQVARLQLTPIGQAIADSQPRHIRCQYLFWQFTKGGAIPLVGLADAVSIAFPGCSWQDLANLYEGMIWLDLALEAEHFSQVAIDFGLLKLT